MWNRSDAATRATAVPGSWASSQKVTSAASEARRGTGRAATYSNRPLSLAWATSCGTAFRPMISSDSVGAPVARYRAVRASRWGMRKASP